MRRHLEHLATGQQPAARDGARRTERLHQRVVAAELVLDLGALGGGGDGGGEAAERDAEVAQFAKQERR